MNGKRPAEPTRGGTGKKRKKEVMVEFSGAVTEEILKKQVAEAWSRRTPFSHEAIVMDMDPFLHCVIPNFIPSPNFLEELQKELLSLDFHEKYNDLYKFQQSDDLKKRREPHICALRKILFEDFRAWLSDVSKIDLECTIDMSCAKYEFSDALLCHDDELEGRRIAFILYLVPPWDGSLGGTLDLYSVDEHFQPTRIVKSLTPSWNTLVFFEVSPVSFHQVSEVLSKEKSRLSISGWFHGPSLTRPPTYFEPPIARSPHIPQDHEILYEWINPTYLDMDHQIQIQEEFEEQSEILLKDFLKPEKFAEVCEALEEGGVRWISRGPPNKRFYEKAEESSLPSLLRDCMTLFRSEALFLLLSNFTGLRLHFLAPSEEGGVEDTKAGEAASAPDSTDEGTSGSSSEPQDSQADISSSSRRSSERTDPEPEENEVTTDTLNEGSPGASQPAGMGHCCCKPYICLQCLDKTSQSALVKGKELSIELANIRDEVAFNTAKCEKLQKEKEELERRFEDEVRKLGWQQQAELQDLQGRLQLQFQAEVTRLQEEHHAQLLRIQHLHQEQVEDITASHEAALLEMENNHTVAIAILQDNHDHKVRELMSTHELEKKELEDNFEKLRLSLQDQVDTLTFQSQSLRDRARRFEEALRKNTEEQLEVALAPYQHLEEDMKSLKQVLEMKNQQIHQQEKKIIELEKLAEKNILLEEKIQVLQQQNEDLKARIDQNTVVTRQLSEENANLQEYVEKETQEKKRLSRTNEELLWKLQTGDPTSPIKLSPTSPVYRSSSSGPSSPARVSTTPR